jgi:glucokinase
MGNADFLTQPNQQPQVLGIDLGGTAIKLGRFRQDGTCLQSLSVATPQPSTPEAVLEVMVEGNNPT